MAEHPRGDEVDKLLAEQKNFEERKQVVIAELLKQREAAIASFDEKLAKLGYQVNSGKGKKSHHKKTAPPAVDAAAKQKKA